MLNNKKEQCIQEYEALRSEIISFLEQQRTVWIYMYVLFCTLFVLGLQLSHYLFLVTYIILIPFQNIINDMLWSVSKISSYIRVFFEEENTNIHWEGLHLYDLYENYYKKRNSGLNSFIRAFGSVHLGFLATVFFCGFTLNNAYKNNIFILVPYDIFFIFLSVVLFFVLLKQDIDYNKNYKPELDKIMEKYKNSIMEKED